MQYYGILSLMEAGNSLTRGVHCFKKKGYAGIGMAFKVAGKHDAAAWHIGVS